MTPLTTLAASVGAVVAIGSSFVGVDKLYVSRSDFDKYIQQQQAAADREYVLELKAVIRSLRSGLQDNPDDAFLLEQLQATIAELCEFRPDDHLCDVGR